MELKMLRRTKIVTTLGPATDREGVLEGILEAGANMVRMNFSHGTAEDHIARAKHIRELAARLGKSIAILGDLQGPKIRVSTFKDNKIMLKVGDKFLLDAELGKGEGTQEQVGIDYKKLPEDVISGEQVKELKGWEVYNLPPFYEFVSQKNYQAGKPVDGPAYYKATFRLDKTGDTFLDMQTWGKGMVWVNGHAMGRFWEIGPQQTLYMPGCWLKEGENEIIVLDLKGPAEAKVAGVEKPILDMLREKAPETHRKDGQNLNLKAEKVVNAGTFKAGNGWQEVRFAQPVAGRYFCLEGISNYEGNNIAAIAELDVLDNNGKPVSRENWKIVYADSEETRSGNRTADKVFDLQESTFWQTVDNTAYPHQIVIDLGKEYNVTGFRMLPRAEAGAPGLIKDYKVYVKKSDFTY
jgi:beta-galactosidase